MPFWNCGLPGATFTFASISLIPMLLLFQTFFLSHWLCLVVSLTASVLFICITLFMLKAYCLLQWWWITKGSTVTQRKLADKSINYPDSWPYTAADCCHEHLGLPTIHLLYYSYYNLINCNAWWIKGVI